MSVLKLVKKLTWSADPVCVHREKQNDELLYRVSKKLHTLFLQ